MQGFQHFDTNKIAKNKMYLFDAKCEKANLHEVAATQDQLTEVQRKKLTAIL